MRVFDIYVYLTIWTSTHTTCLLLALTIWTFTLFWYLLCHYLNVHANMFTACSYYLNVHPILISTSLTIWGLHTFRVSCVLCVIRSGSAIFRYFLRQKVTVIFEFLKFQISKFWPYGHKHPQEHSLWVWWLNSGPTYHYVSRICQKSTFFVCFFTKSQSENFRRLFLKKKKEIFYSDKICRSFRKVCVEWRANEQNLFLRIFENFSKFFQNFLWCLCETSPMGPFLKFFFSKNYKASKMSPYRRHPESMKS